MTITDPHDPYINAIAQALTEAGMTPEQADAFVEDSYDVPWLRGVFTLTPETSGIPADGWRHGLIVVWDWHTGRDKYSQQERGPVWQWARLNEDGSNQELQELPVPGWATPAVIAAQAATLAHTGKPIPMSSGWREDKVTAALAAIHTWEATA